VDEVQTGFGRTGRFFVVDHPGTRPDIMIMAKAIASGLPLSAIVAREDLMKRWPAGSHDRYDDFRDRTDEEVRKLLGQPEAESTEASTVPWQRRGTRQCAAKRSSSATAGC
jgi:glutamate-1-semialdehyde aminotransferase